MENTLRQNLAADNTHEKPLIWQLVAGVESQYLAMGEVKQPQEVAESWRELLARNIRNKMRATLGLETSDKLAQRAYWTDGKRRGKRVGARTIRHLLAPGPDAPSPSLDLIVAIAAALDVEPFELLVDNDLTRRHILERIIGLKPDGDGQAPHQAVRAAPGRKRVAARRK